MNYVLLFGGSLLFASVANGLEGDDTHAIKHSPEATLQTLTDEELGELFQKRPLYGDTIHAQAQSDTYKKAVVPTQRPWLELGRRLYTTGPAQVGGTFPFGKKNLLFPHFMVYGDWRTAVGYSDNGANDTGRLATRLNLDLDLGLTATERIHALIRPLDRDGKFTQIGFSGDDDGIEELRLDGNIETLFFEGDLGAIFGGPGADSVPIAFGKVPLLFQNGIWVEDAFVGAAVTLPAKNSAKWDIANYDMTFFAGVDDITTGAAVGPVDEEDVKLFGLTSFLEANDGYWEVGYAFVDGSGAQNDIDYHNLTAAFSRRFGKTVSSSLRVIANVGQDRDPGNVDTADGALILLENSLITRKPSTLLPYLNFFSGFGTPQSLARDGGAGGVLKNTGINFETDAITRFPSLNATGHDAFGAAVGIEYLFNLDKQVVFEVAAQHPHGSDAKALGDQVAVGFRYQQPFRFFGARSALWRVDAMTGFLEDEDDISGIRFEMRWKF